MVCGWLRDPANPLESHYAIRKDGAIYQLVPDDQRADANASANRRPDGIQQALRAGEISALVFRALPGQTPAAHLFAQIVRGTPHHQHLAAAA